MPLSKNVLDNESRKFDVDSNDDVVVRVKDTDGGTILTDIETNTSPVSSTIYDTINVTNTATPVRVGVANMVGRTYITIQAKGSTVFIGTDNTVTSGNSGSGFKLTSNSSITFAYDESITVYAIKSGGGNAKVYVSEGTR